MRHSCQGDRHRPCPPQVLGEEEKDPATGEVPVAGARGLAPRLGLHVTSKDVGLSYAGGGGDVHMC